MNRRSLYFFVLIYLLVFSTGACQSSKTESSTAPVEQPENLLVYEVDLNKIELAFFYKNEKGENYGNHQALKMGLAEKNKKLLFAVNGGMYNRDQTPQGLYIERGKLLAPLDTLSEGYGNFYLQPNGVFYLTKNKIAAVIRTDKFVLNEDVYFATQSGPMLLIDGKIHPKFREGSTNLYIRNAVGTLPDGKVLFVMSRQKINFFDLATYFKSRGCLNALYLDGFVSRTYLPSQDWEQIDGNFGVIIGAVENNN